MEKQIYFQGIGEYLAPYARYFRRSEARDLAQSYVVGLMMDGERKSVEPMSERVHGSERGMQRLLTDVIWDEAGAMREYRQQMLAETTDPQGILVVDDTGFPKKGKHSVCVARQYCGARGKVENCQVGVSMSYVGREVCWPYAMDLFVPESWDDLNDLECRLMRTKTHMPDSARHRQKWRIALEQIDLARAQGVAHRAVVSDGWYGNIAEFRQGLESRGESYVVGIYSSTEVFLEAPVFEVPQPKERKRGRPAKRPRLIETHPKPIKVFELGEAVQEGAWEHLELRRDSRQKPLIAEAVTRRVWPANGYRQGSRHEEVWLIIERRWKKRGEYELRYFFSNMPQTMPAIEIVRLLHERFWIEQGYQQLKEELGLDHHEGRSWPGWHRHVFLVFLTFGYLTRIRLQEKKRQQQLLWENWLRLRTQDKEHSN